MRHLVARKRHEQEHRDKGDGDDVEGVERRDEAVREVGGVGPNDLGENEREHDRSHEGREPRPGALRAIEGDRAERREQRPQDHRTRLVEAAKRDHTERGSDEDQQELDSAQEREVPVPGEDREADDRSGDVAPWRECDCLLADDPVQVSPQEPRREDEQRDTHEEPLAEALVGRVGRISPIPSARSRSSSSRPALMTGERVERATLDVCRRHARSSFEHGQPPSIRESWCLGCGRLGGAGAVGPARPRLRLLRRRRARQGRDARAALASDRRRDPSRQRRRVRSRVPRGAARLPVGPRKLAFGWRSRSISRCIRSASSSTATTPPGRAGVPPLLTNRRAFAQATWRHALFGAVLGRLPEPPLVAAASLGHPGRRQCCVGSRSRSRSRSR